MSGLGVAAKDSDDLLESLEWQWGESPALLAGRSRPEPAGMP